MSWNYQGRLTVKGWKILLIRNLFPGFKDLYNGSNSFQLAQKMQTRLHISLDEMVSKYPVFEKEMIELKDCSVDYARDLIRWSLMGYSNSRFTIFESDDSYYKKIDEGKIIPKSCDSNWTTQERGFLIEFFKSNSNETVSAGCNAFIDFFGKNKRTYVAIEGEIGRLKQEGEILKVSVNWNLVRDLALSLRQEFLDKGIRKDYLDDIVEKLSSQFPTMPFNSNKLRGFYYRYGANNKNSDDANAA